MRRAIKIAVCRNRHFFAALFITPDAFWPSASSHVRSTALFEPSLAMFRPKGADGSWLEPFDQFAWGKIFSLMALPPDSSMRATLPQLCSPLYPTQGGDYTEAGPWQYRFYVPHDPKGLAALYAKYNQSMCSLLETVRFCMGFPVQRGCLVYQDGFSFILFYQCHLNFLFFLSMSSQPLTLFYFSPLAFGNRPKPCPALSTWEAMAQRSMSRQK